MGVTRIGNLVFRRKGVGLIDMPPYEVATVAPGGEERFLGELGVGGQPALFEARSADHSRIRECGSMSEVVDFFRREEAG